MAANSYHKGYTPEERRAVDREYCREKRAVKRTDRILNQEVIVWDGEGMKLSGPTAPQHYVLFGCSARPNSPLIIEKDGDRLTFQELADYALDVADQHPNAVHLGYYFTYDQNMIIWSLPWPTKQVLYSKGSCIVRRGTTKYFIRLVFRKTIRISRVRDNRKSTILIQDMGTFFASKFTVAYNALCTPADPDNWAIVEQGKKDRADMLFDDMPKVRRYWRAEIIALKELADEFRRLMFDAGFLLTEWHGPGALANYIRRNYDLIRHEWGGKEENLPGPVHEATKGGYFGGHFEQFKVGYVKGPVYAYDKNSAYPHAFCAIPSLSENGKWRHVGPVTESEWATNKRLRTSFSVFKVKWRGCAKDAHRWDILNRIQPFPRRDSKANITFPPFVTGWYWCPEVAVGMVMQRRNREQYSCEILDCWTWDPDPALVGTDDEWPWERVIRYMYKRRLQLKDNNNPTQMAFKLGPNSMYGKMAQRAGGKDKAPKSHTLPIAGYVTSTCRAAVMQLMQHCPPEDVLSVETDGVYTLTPPDKLKQFPMSKELGEWDLKVYDAMILLQNGVYLVQKEGKWKIKSRGFDPDALTAEIALEHLSRCTPENWPVIGLGSGENFLGLGNAIARSTRLTKQGVRSTNPFKASDLHCTWVPDKKEINLAGGHSKRIHHAKLCGACHRGQTPAETTHDMTLHPKALDPTEWDSVPYTLPWEKNTGEVTWTIMRELLDDAAGIRAEIA
jgi:hypothetical protein